MFTYRVATPLRLTRQCDGNEATISTHLKFICSMVYETTYSLIGLLYYLRQNTKLPYVNQILDDLENGVQYVHPMLKKIFSNKTSVLYSLPLNKQRSPSLAHCSCHFSLSFLSFFLFVCLFSFFLSWTTTLSSCKLPK